MFGHQDDQNDDHHHHDDQPIENVLSEPVADGLLSHDGADNGAVVGDGGVHDNGFNPALPTSDDDQPGFGHSVQDLPAPVSTDDGAVPAPVADDASSAPAVSSSADDDLLSIKQQALTELSPLVDHLNQSPEEKFRTTMMMIQAADNQALIKNAYEAAQAIPDEKVKAQALLDIVNEINYFTQHNA